uniref:Uncharacterized protein n=1 Tax=Acrobeloides nanus TaxID=290746 RepID=A0A914CU72_9BILA
MGEEELEFARAAVKFKVPVCFVCSRCDVYLYSRQQSGDIDEMTQDEADRLIKELRPKFDQEIARVPEIDSSDVPLFFISAPSLRRLIQFIAKPENGLPNNYIRYEESRFIEYLQKKSAESRSI